MKPHRDSAASFQRLARGPVRTGVCCHVPLQSRSYERQSFDGGLSMHALGGSLCRQLKLSEVVSLAGRRRLPPA